MVRWLITRRSTVPSPASSIESSRSGGGHQMLTRQKCNVGISVCFFHAMYLKALRTSSSTIPVNLKWKQDWLASSLDVCSEPEMRLFLLPTCPPFTILHDAIMRATFANGEMWITAIFTQSNHQPSQSPLSSSDNINIISEPVIFKSRCGNHFQLPSRVCILEFPQKVRQAYGGGQINRLTCESEGNWDHSTDYAPRSRFSPFCNIECIEFAANRQRTALRLRYMRTRATRLACVCT